MECRARSCGIQFAVPGTVADPNGIYASDPANDHTIPPIGYSASIIDDVLWVYPWISSTNSVRVVYRGVKRSWADNDLVPVSWMDNGSIDPELLDYLIWSLDSRKNQCDPPQLQAAEFRIVDRRQRLMNDEDRLEDLRLQLERPCYSCSTTYPGGFGDGFYVPTSPPTIPPTVSAPTESQLGDSEYMHPVSRNRYYFFNGLYYLITIVSLDGIVQEAVSQIGITPPV